MRIIGIDPGTGILGFGVIDFQSHHKPVVMDAGVITTPAHTRLKARLLDIYNSLNEIIDATKPEVMSIEKLFFARNITTASRSSRLSQVMAEPTRSKFNRWLSFTWA